MEKQENTKIDKGNNCKRIPSIAENNLLPTASKQNVYTLVELEKPSKV